MANGWMDDWNTLLDRTCYYALQVFLAVVYNIVPQYLSSRQTINMYSNRKGAISSPYHSQLHYNAYSLKPKRPPMHQMQPQKCRSRAIQ